MAELAILGGPKTRTSAMANRPHVSETERKYLDECLKGGFFSRFIGSPLGDFRRDLAMTSAEVENQEAFWSVLGGPYVRKFEAAFARKFGVKYAVSSNSATS